MSAKEDEWNLVVQELEVVDKVLISDALGQLNKVIKEDGKAGKQMKRAFETITKVRAVHSYGCCPDKMIVGESRWHHKGSNSFSRGPR